MVVYEVLSSRLCDPHHYVGFIFVSNAFSTFLSICARPAFGAMLFGKPAQEGYQILCVNLIYIVQPLSNS